MSQINKIPMNNISLRRSSVDQGYKKIDSNQSSIISEQRMSNEISTAQTRTNSNLFQFDMKKKQDNCFNSKNSLKIDEDCNSKISSSNLDEDLLQEQAESKGILTHSLQTKRNLLSRDKENQLLYKDNQQDQQNWKQKYQELQQIFSQKSRQQFIHERTINELQIKLQNEKNKNKFYEKNQEIFNNLQQQIEESNIKRRQIEEQLNYVQQQNEKLKNQLTPSSSQKISLHQVLSQISTPTSSSSNYVSLRKKSHEGRLSMSKERNNRQSVTSIDNKRSSDSNQIKILQANELFNATQQNKILLLKVSDLEKQVAYLLDQQCQQEQQIQSINQENEVLSGKISEYSQILNQIGFFQFESIRDNLLNQIKPNPQSLQPANLDHYNNTNSFAQYRNFSDIPFQKNEHYESVSDQSMTNKLSNTSQETSKQNTQIQLQRLVDFREIKPRIITPILMNTNLNDHKQMRRQLEHPYIDEIQFVQDNGENTHRLSKLCSC